MQIHYLQTTLEELKQVFPTSASLGQILEAEAVCITVLLQLPENYSLN
ncbi:MAG: hypothetical protein Kow00121_68520 [Elainellaceae cyanobacterium]